MCEPTTLAAIGTWMTGAAAGSTAAVTAGMATTALAGTALATGLSAYGMYQQGKYQQGVAEANAKLTEFEADRAMQRAEDEAAVIRRRGAQMKGDQRAAFAARGLDLSSGTPADILDQTDFFTQTDIATTRSNAKVDRELARYGAKLQRVEGANARRSGNLEAFSTLLTGATRVAGKWYDYKQAGVWG